MKIALKLTACLAAFALSGACLAQSATDAPKTTPKKDDPSTHVQITSDTGSKRHCRDTDVKSADGRMPAQTSTERRLETSQTDCKKQAPKIPAPSNDNG